MLNKWATFELHLEEIWGGRIKMEKEQMEAENAPSYSQELQAKMEAENVP